MPTDVATEFRILMALELGELKDCRDAVDNAEDNHISDKEKRDASQTDFGSVARGDAYEEGSENLRGREGAVRRAVRGPTRLVARDIH